MENDIKNALRQRMKSIRAGLGDREEKNRKILDYLIGSEFYAQARNILTYYSVGTEADTLPLIAANIRYGKKTALPVTNDDYRLKFYIYDTESQMKKGIIGIPEPIGTKEADTVKFDLCIIPALACDIRGYRLGYGKGCYDRFLKEYKGIKAVLCFSDCLIESVYPEKWDIRSDYVVSDRGIIKF